MNKQKTIKKELTQDEADLIEAIRNYNLAYPNGAVELLYYAESLFNALTDRP